MPSNLGPKSQRRQNASCDRCRHSKRRCLMAPVREGEAEPICTNCKRLCYPCTFNFVESRKVSVRPRSSAKPPAFATLLSESLTPGLLSVGDTGSYEAAGDGSQVVHIHNRIAEPSIDIDFESFVDFGSDSFPDLPDLLADLEHTQSANTSRPKAGGRDFHNGNYSPRFDAGKTFPRPHFRSIVGCSLNSPVHLLSSSWEAWLLREQLARIYQTITSGSASIFLDYDCNLLTSSCRYQFDSSNPTLSNDSALGLSNAIPTDASQKAFMSEPLPQLTNKYPNQALKQSHTNHTSLPTQISRERPPSRAITVLGAVRYLDHFGELYGNKSSVASKAQSDQILKEVLRCFSVQWLPNKISSLESDLEDIMISGPYTSAKQQTPQSSLAFVDTWVRARSLIQNAQSTLSFGVVYATLLFDTIIIPIEVFAGIEDNVHEHEFLDNAFDKLSHLELQVKKYCENLGTESQHGALMESSLSIIRWFAYLRDTVVGLTADRPCRLEDAQSHNKGT